MAEGTVNHIDFKALVRRIRAGGLMLSGQVMEAHRRGAGGSSIDRLQDTSEELQQMATDLEQWREHHAEALRQYARSGALDGDFLDSIAQQLDPREPEQQSLSGVPPSGPP